MFFVFQIGAGASQDRLEKLVQQRLYPAADRAEVAASATRGVDTARAGANAAYRVKSR